jgi:hypothetical protein
MGNSNSNPYKLDILEKHISDNDIVNHMINYLESPLENRFKIPYLIKKLYNNFPGLYHYIDPTSTNYNFQNFSINEIIVGTNTPTPLPKSSAPSQKYSNINLYDHVFLNYKTGSLNGIINNINTLNPVLLKKNSTITVINIENVLAADTLYDPSLNGPPPISIPILYKSLKEIGDELSNGQMFTQIQQLFASKISELILFVKSYYDFAYNFQGAPRLNYPDPFEQKLIVIITNIIGLPTTDLFKIQKENVNKNPYPGLKKFFPNVINFLPTNKPDTIELQKYIKTFLVKGKLPEYDFHNFLTNRLHTLPVEFRNPNGTLDEAPHNNLQQLKLRFDICIQVSYIYIKACNFDYTLGEYDSNITDKGSLEINDYYNQPDFFYMLQEIVKNTLNISDSALSIPTNTMISEWKLDETNQTLLQVNDQLKILSQLYIKSDINRDFVMKQSGIDYNALILKNTGIPVQNNAEFKINYTGWDIKVPQIFYIFDQPIVKMVDGVRTFPNESWKGNYPTELINPRTETYNVKNNTDYIATYNDEQLFYSYIYNFLSLLPETKFIDLNTIKEKEYNENLKAQTFIDNLDINDVNIPSSFTKVGTKISTSIPAIDSGKNIIFIEDSTKYEIRTIEGTSKRETITTSIDKSDIISLTITKPSVIILIKPACSLINITYMPYQMKTCGNRDVIPVYNFPPPADKKLFGFIPNILNIPNTTNRLVIIVIIFLFLVIGGIGGYSSNLILSSL